MFSCYLFFIHIFTTVFVVNLTRSQIPDNFKFKEYCPLVFKNLRSRFGIEDEFYQVCWVVFTSAEQ